MSDMFELAKSIGQLVNTFLNPMPEDPRMRAFLSDELVSGGGATVSLRL